jgi:hypothetical protein
MHGTAVVGNEMGVNTWAAFAGDDEHAVVDGDFAMRESELHAVLRSMRASGINIVAIHQHMTIEEPRIMFLHYWGKETKCRADEAVRRGIVALASSSDRYSSFAAAPERLQRRSIVDAGRHEA